MSIWYCHLYSSVTVPVLHKTALWIGQCVFGSILLLMFTIMSQQLISPSAVCMCTFVAYTDGVASILQPASTCCVSESC